MYQHLYFNEDYSVMIELLLNRHLKSTKPIYKMYNLNDVLPMMGLDKIRSYRFNQVLNTEESMFIEWHHKTLYPYTLNLENFNQLSKDIVSGYEVFKHQRFG
jgi:hypothetical protein